MITPEPWSLVFPKVRRYLETAELTRRSGDYDSAISRLYYAMFYCAETLLWERGLRFSKHKGVISRFGLHFAKTELLPSELHGWLRAAFAKRQVSEYGFDQPATEADVADFQEKAAEFLRQTEAFLQAQQ